MRPLFGRLAFLVLWVSSCSEPSKRDEPPSCDDCECEDYCRALCSHVDTTCGGSSIDACLQGCFDTSLAICPLDSIAARSCDDLEDEASCYESNSEYCAQSVPLGLCEPGLNVLCSFGQYCDPETSMCRLGCGRADDCDFHELCNLTEHLCELAPCDEDGDCPNAHFCNAMNECVECSADTCDGVCDSGRCVECTLNTHCEPMQECSANVCRDRCNDSIKCEEGRVCLGGDGVCSDLIEAACDHDESRCYGGYCRTDSLSMVPVEPYCSVDCVHDDCPDGYDCVDYACVHL
jgi:hypothetical protein